MRQILGLALFLLIYNVNFLSAQKQFWSDIDEDQIFLSPQSEVQIATNDYRVLQLNFEAINANLQFAPVENSAAAKNNPFILEFPTPDGTMERCMVTESPVMMPGLAARYPEIKSYKVVGENNALLNGRIDVSLNGFRGAFNSEQGKYYIDAYASHQKNYYVAYYSKNIEVDESIPLSCGYEPDTEEERPFENTALEEVQLAQKRGGNPVDMRVYILALACTGEYAENHGNTKPSVLSSMNTAVNRINLIFENEVAIRLMLVEGNDSLIWLDPDTDPYINADQGTALLGQNTSAINTIGGITADKYDLGHVFTAGCTDVAGVVSGRACTGGKARGVTCHYTNNIETIAVQVMAHEIAHQFAVAHSWSNCPPYMGQLASDRAFEPGSGSTIMSYSGSCGPENIQFGSDDYYNIGSLESFINYTRQGGASDCPTLETTENTEPELTLNYEDGFVIPISTPFQLTATGSDAEEDPITYCWEQYDLGPVSDLGDPQGDAPLFRSFPPKTSPTRIFPRIQDVIGNNMDVREVLPTYSRNLTFKCTLRDNHPGAGGTVWESVGFKSTASAGPFLVMEPNGGSTNWRVGEYTEVSWDVANTDNNKVNCQQVNIKLSLDGGYTYPITLIENTSNDGAEFVTVPNNISNKARIKIEAADNIFFDISNNNFKILEAEQAGVAVTVTPATQRICLPDVATIEVQSAALLDFQNTVNLDLVGNLPEGAVVSFGSDTLSPSESTMLSIDLREVEQQGLFDLQLRFAAEGIDTAYRNIELTLVSNDFSDLALANPFDGQSDITLSTEFEWTGSQHALTYDFELATSPAFGESIIESVEGLENTAYLPELFLEDNTLYYWRVRPHNVCGPGDFTEAFGMHTVNVVCSPTDSEDVPKNISGSGLPTIESKIFVETFGSINDINIPYLRANYQPVSSLRVTLISPSGTQVKLFDQNCANTLDMVIGFDDSSPLDIPCPPDNGVVVKPVEPLSVLQGEEIHGEWTLKIKVVTGGFGGGGRLTNWKLEFCANAQSIAPQVLTNDTLFVTPGGTNTITADKLEMMDDDNSPQQIEYTIVTPPANGTLYFLDQALIEGDTFRQSSINGYNIYYVHDGSDTENDRFTFTVNDGTGGWIPNQIFNIKIDENAAVGTKDIIRKNEFRLYPNPTSGRLNIVLNQQLDEEIVVRIFNAQGAMIKQYAFEGSQSKFQTDISDFTPGVYFVNLLTERGISVRKLVVQ